MYIEIYKNCCTISVTIPIMIHRYIVIIGTSDAREIPMKAMMHDL